MTKSQSHILCTHPATKAARAACRKTRQRVSQNLRTEIQAAVDLYFTDQTVEVADIVVTLDGLSMHANSPSLTAAVRGYWDETLEIEEVIGLAQRAVGEV